MNSIINKYRRTVKEEEKIVIIINQGSDVKEEFFGRLGNSDVIYRAGQLIDGALVCLQNTNMNLSTIVAPAFNCRVLAPVWLSEYIS